jgi:NADH:ubiquinone oxidoreductase subunit
MYLNASDERTKDTVRDRIRDFLRTAWKGVTRKIVIFDEVETMTLDAQLTLCSLMDSSLIAGAQIPLFIFLCNTLSRIVPLVRSRALALYCGHLTSTQIRGLLADIQARESRTDTPLPTPLACLLNRGDMRAFLQRAQAGEDPNTWLPWLQRLLNAPPDRAYMVWEDGLQRVPAWILLRHVLVFCYSMGIPARVGPAPWSAWLEIAVSRPTTATQIAAAWAPVATALLNPEK